MSVGSFKSLNNITKKVNEAIGKVTTSKAFTKAFGGVSQVLRRFPTPQDIANLPDPLKSAQWEVIFPSISVSTGGLHESNEIFGRTTGDNKRGGNAKWFSYNPVCETSP